MNIKSITQEALEHRQTCQELVKGRRTEWPFQEEWEAFHDVSIDVLSVVGENVKLRIKTTQWEQTIVVCSGINLNIRPRT